MILVVPAIQSSCLKKDMSATTSRWMQSLQRLRVVSAYLFAVGVYGGNDIDEPTY
jgi:hypothetical protein